MRAEQLADRRDRDGGSAGVSAPALLSTVSGHLQRDPVTGLRVLRDEHWAGGDMAFTLGSVPKFDRGKYAPPRPDTSAPGGSPFSLHR
ncbi:adhesin [Bordetella pertussis]|nr:adhesin [Bordetella pertussis]